MSDHPTEKPEAAEPRDPRQDAPDARMHMPEYTAVSDLWGVMTDESWARFEDLHAVWMEECGAEYEQALADHERLDPRPLPEPDGELDFG